MDRSRLARMHASEDNVPWTTVSKALAEIDKLLPETEPPGVNILEDCDRYLRAMPLG